MVCGKMRNFPLPQKNVHQLVILRFLEPELENLSCIFEYCPLYCGMAAHIFTGSRLFCGVCHLSVHNNNTARLHNHPEYYN